MSKLEQICKFYDISTAAGQDIVDKLPQFAGYDHERVMREATAVYGNETKVKKAILKFPQFAGYDHTRVHRQKTRIGRLVGLSDQETLDIILENPVQAGYSYMRNLARIDVARTLTDEGVAITNEIRDWFVSKHIESPYAPGRLRTSHSEVEPNLLIMARKKFVDQLKAA